MAATEPALNTTPTSPEDKTVFSLLSNIKDKTETTTTTVRSDLDDDIVILKRDPETHQSVINKSVYLRLHKTVSPENTSTVDKIKVKYEQDVQKVEPENKESKTIESLKNKYSPSGLGYTRRPPVTPRKSRLTKSQILVASKREQAQRRSLNFEPKKNKDVNSNELQSGEKSNEDDDEFITIVTRSDSEESIHKFEKELSMFTMDKKKRPSSFRKIFSVFSNKDKKRKSKAETIQNGDNLHNESAFSKQSPYRHTTTGSQNKTLDLARPKLQRSDSDPDEIGKKMELLLSEGLQPTNNLQRNSNTGYTNMDKPLYTTYMNVPHIRKYIDTSSSASTLESEKSNIFHQNSLNKPKQIHEDEVDIRPNNSLRPNRISDGRRDTPPRLMETIKQDVRLVNPKALIPINSERPLPNPYQSSSGNQLSPTENSMSRSRPLYQSTPTSPESRNTFLDETYGTVFDSLDNRHRSSINQRNTPVESTKLKLPPNREIVPLSPRVKSPIPSDSVSTDKIIATELLKNKQENSFTKERTRSQQRLNFDFGTQHDNTENIYNSQANRNDHLVVKPPIPGKIMNPHEPDSRRTSQTRSSNESVVLRQPQTPNQYLSNQSIYLRRPLTPLGNPIPDSPKTTPQKDDMRKSVEAYYWKEIKKLKDQENYQLYLMQMQYGYADDAINVRRSRSMSPVASRTGRRSLSLPRDGRPPLNVMTEPIYPNVIPENRAVVQPRSMQQLQFQQQQQQHQYQQQYFQRNAPERSTIDGASPRKNGDGTNSLYKPIFKRGSLSTPPRQTMEDSLKRKVSFSSQDQNVQVWPTRNGYTQSPPQRRIEKMQGNTDDEVFLPSSPLRRNEENLYYSGPRQSMAEPGYVLRASQNSLYLHHRQPIENPHRVRASNMQQDLYGLPLDAVRPPLARHGSIQIQEELYGQRPIPRRISYQNVNPPKPLPAPPQQEIYQLTTRRPNGLQLPPPRREIIVNDEIFGEFGGYYPSNSLRQDNVRVVQYYPQKHVTVSNKTCDIYGQIHDLDREKNIQQSGVILGQVRRPQENFIRNSRLTSSANDMYRKMPQSYPNEALYGRIEQNGPPNRPLPPVPLKKGLVSDTESGSDASEIQRILNNSKSNKKRGIFGK